MPSRMSEGYDLAHDKAGALRVTTLKADFVHEPLGLENRHPRLSWCIESDDRNVRQSAFQILVATDRAILEAGQGNLWDSGKVSSAESLAVPYAGKELSSRQRCWWCVRVWDHRGEVSSYSAPSFFEMGLLAADDWQAQWIAAEDHDTAADRAAGMQWIWGAENDDALPRKFRLKMNLATPARRAALILGSKDRLHRVWLDGAPLPVEKPPRYAVGLPAMTELDLGPLAAGAHVLAVEVLLERFSCEVPPPPGMTALVRLEHEGGSIERIGSARGWRTTTAPAHDWIWPDHDDNTWEEARPAPPLKTQPWPPAPATHLRKQFAVERAITRARLYVTAHGAYEAFLNGRRVGDALLAPESTLFSKRTLYRAYDVAELIDSGMNVLAVTVGDGWYASTFNALGRYAFGPPPRRLLAQLELTFDDGSRQVIGSGPDWRIARGPIVRSEIFDGEVYDARLAIAGWELPGFDDSRWEPAVVAEQPTCRLVAQLSPPIRATQVLKPHAITSPEPGVHVVDFGQNFAGWCRLRARGGAGTRIEMQFAEVLLPSGKVDRSNLRAAKQTDVFILAGTGAEETFEPKFTYHGFRYVQISGLPSAPTSDAIEGIVIHSDLPLTGALRVDHPLIDRIWRNTVWTQRSNFTGIPTDCPQRDERRGYLADAAVFWDAAAFNMDVDTFARRHMDNVRDSQTPEGVYQTHAPTPIQRCNPFPGWADGAIVLPWYTWQRYGDLQVIEDNWESMNRHVQFVLEHNPDYLWLNRRGEYGDWLCVDARFNGDPTTPHELIATAYWAHDLDLLAQMADAIGRSEDARHLRELHDRVRRAFIDTFVAADGRVGNASQTSFVLALKFGLVPEHLRAAAAERLVADIRSRGGSLSTGILGTQHILDVLADAGYTSVAYDLILRTQFPSWGYMIAQGATTIWESWNGRVWSGLKGDRESMPNSYNHFALGAVCGFFFRRIAGIDAGTPGFRNIVMRPAIDPRVRRAGADYLSPMGKITVDWAQVSNRRFTMSATIPANTTARIHLPARADQRVRESRVQLFESDPPTVARTEDELTLEVGSGSYEFTVE